MFQKGNFTPTMSQQSKTSKILLVTDKKKVPAGQLAKKRSGGGVEGSCGSGICGGQGGKHDKMKADPKRHFR